MKITPIILRLEQYHGVSLMHYGIQFYSFVLLYIFTKKKENIKMQKTEEAKTPHNNSFFQEIGMME